MTGWVVVLAFAVGAMIVGAVRLAVAVREYVRHPIR